MEVYPSPLQTGLFSVFFAENFMNTTVCMKFSSSKSNKIISFWSAKQFCMEQIFFEARSWKTQSYWRMIRLFGKEIRKIFHPKPGLDTPPRLKHRPPFKEGESALKIKRTNRLPLRYALFQKHFTTYKYFIQQDTAISLNLQYIFYSLNITDYNIIPHYIFILFFTTTFKNAKRTPAEIGNCPERLQKSTITVLDKTKTYGII